MILWLFTLVAELFFFQKKVHRLAHFGHISALSTLALWLTGTSELKDMTREEFEILVHSGKHEIIINATFG